MNVLQQFGLGTDIVRVKRFEEKPYFTNQRFYKKIFLDSEIKYCLKHTNHAIHFSGKFAIKEAVIKSLKMKISLIDIVTDHSNSKPTVKINNYPDYFFIITLSHDKDYAIAVVLSEKS